MITSTAIVLQFNIVTVQTMGEIEYSLIRPMDHVEHDVEHGAA